VIRHLESVIRLADEFVDRRVYLSANVACLGLQPVVTQHIERCQFRERKILTIFALTLRVSHCQKPHTPQQWSDDLLAKRALVLGVLGLPADASQCNFSL